MAKTTSVPGTVNELPSGSWRAQFVDRSSGRPQRVGKTLPTEDEARAWLVEQAAQRQRGSWIDHRRGETTIGDVGQLWLAGRNPRRKASSKADELSVWTHLVEPRWGAVALADVRHSTVRAWVAELQATGKTVVDSEGKERQEPLSSSRTKKALMMLSNIIDLAVRDRMIPGPNPCDGLRAERIIPQAEPVIITVRQVEDLLDAVRKDAADTGKEERGWSGQLLVALMAYGGLRWGEATALRRSDIADLDGRAVVTVRRSFSEIGGMHEQAPKSYRERSLVLPVHAGQLVLGCALLLGREGNELLVQTENGSPFRRHWVTRRWRDLVGNANLPGDITPHDLRASHATHCVAAGMPVLDVAKRLGHSHSAVLVAHYARASWSDVQVADAVDGLVTLALTEAEKEQEDTEPGLEIARQILDAKAAMDYVRRGGKPEHVDKERQQELDGMTTTARLVAASTT